MQVLLISIVCLLIITLIFIVLPSNMTFKGRLTVVGIAFVLSNIGFAVQYLYESLLISLGSLFLLVLIMPLLMKRSSRFFFKEEIHSEYITTYTAKDMNKQKAELDEDKERIFTDKSKPLVENKDNIISNPIEEVEEVKMDKEGEVSLEKWNESSEDIIILDEKEEFNKPEEVKVWSNVIFDSLEESPGSPPKEDYWKNDNVVLRENSIEAFLEEINANKDNEKEEDHLEEIEEKPNRRYLERLGKIKILDNSDSPKDND